MQKVTIGEGESNENVRGELVVPNLTVAGVTLPDSESNTH